MNCEYYLDWYELYTYKRECERYIDDHNPEILSCSDPKSQIDKMKELCSNLLEEDKWVTIEDINELARKMGVK